jgi:transposase
LPLFPGSKGISGVASVLHFQLSARISVLRRAKQSPQNYPWLAQLMARRPFKVVAIALANKMARVALALLARGEAAIGRHRSRQREKRATDGRMRLRPCVF